jgi:hypothetical protein
MRAYKLLPRKTNETKSYENHTFDNQFEEISSKYLEDCQKIIAGLQKNYLMSASLLKKCVISKKRPSPQQRGTIQTAMTIHHATLNHMRTNSFLSRTNELVIKITFQFCT